VYKVLFLSILWKTSATNSYHIHHSPAHAQYKTTLARRLYEELAGADNVNHIVHDYYYKDISHLSLEERARTNFDHPAALDTDLLVQHIQHLKKGLSCQIPTYDFATHSRTKETIAMPPRQIILVEGILIFCHPELCQELDVKVFVVRAFDIMSGEYTYRSIDDRVSSRAA
jgi:uridine kinase